MPTEKPRVTFTVSQDMLSEINEFRFNNKIKNQTQAILTLIEKGLSEYLSEAKNSPPFSDEEPQYLRELKRIYHSLNDTGKNELLHYAQYLDEREDFHAAPRMSKDA